MSDFWKSFKSVFVVEEQTPMQTSTTNATSAKPTTQPEKIPPPQYQAPAQTQAATGSGREKAMQVLAAAMEAANPVGFDYFEYRQALSNLANMPMDEPTRYKSAYAMAQTMQVTNNNLIQSAEKYLGVLNAEKQRFEHAAENQQSAQVGTKQAEIENLDLVIKQKAEQIKKLTEEIEEHQKAQVALREEVNAAGSKVIQARADFEASYSLLVSQIQKDIDNMKRYL